jgi:hypothetical protein
MRDELIDPVSEHAETATLTAEAEQILSMEDELEVAETKAKALKEAVQNARRRLAARFAEEQVQSVKTKSGATVYLSRNLQVSKGTGVDTEALIATLDKLELGEFARRQVIYASLKSWVRERDEEHQQEHPGATAGEALPAELRRLLNVYEETTIGIRRGSSK